MTIQELYDWGKENHCLEVTLAKNSNLNIYDIKDVIKLSSVFPTLTEEDKIILD